MVAQIDARYTGDDVQREMAMVLTDKRGAKRHRRLMSFRKAYDDESKQFLRFMEPKDIAGPSFLIWEHKGAENER